MHPDGASFLIENPGEYRVFEGTWSCDDGFSGVIRCGYCDPVICTRDSNPSCSNRGESDSDQTHGDSVAS